MAKWDFIKSISIVSDAFGGEIKVIPSGNYESADWGKYSVTFEANRSFVNSELTVIVKGRDLSTRAGRVVNQALRRSLVKGIEGDFMLDHVLLTSSLNTSGCRHIVDLKFQ